MRSQENDIVTNRLLNIIRKLSPEEQKELLIQLEKIHFQNRRRHSRVPFFEEARLHEKDEQWYADFVTNISAGGLFLETREPFKVGQDIKLVLSPVGAQEAIELAGEIVRKEIRGIAIRLEKPFQPFEEIAKPRVRTIEVLEGKAFETLKMFLQERLSIQLFQGMLLYKWRIRRLLAPFMMLMYYGQDHYCPVCCSHISKFSTNVVNSRPDARCPVCRCLERHRLDWLFLQSKTDLFDGAPKKMLHIAPETIFESRFKKLNYLEYVTADLTNPRAMYNFDITNIPFPRDSFDVIYCSHVLEHVPDDKKAIRELHRVLRHGGWGLLQVPVTAETTFEDPSVTDPSKRKKLFGQHDHIRRYGPDFKNRLEEGGFKTIVFSASDLIKNEKGYLRLGIQKHRIIFLCEKI